MAGSTPKGARLVIDCPQVTSRVCELNAAPLRKTDTWLATSKKHWTP